MYKKRTAFTLIELSIVILIIGIIAAGITQSSRLITSFRITSAQNLTKSSPVAGIENLVTWWEAVSEESFNDIESSDGVKISSWRDINPQINNKHNILQANNSNKPIYRKSAIGGLPSLEFNGTSQYLELPYGDDLNTMDFTIFAVSQPINAPAANSYGTIFSSRSLTAKGYMLHVSSSLQYQTWVGTNNLNWRGANITASAILNKPILICATYNGSNNGSYTLYRNGSMQATTGYTPYSANTTMPFRIGAGKNESAIPDFYFSGYIGEIIMFNRILKIEEMALIDTYLKKKWGI